MWPAALPAVQRKSVAAKINATAASATPPILRIDASRRAGRRSTVAMPANTHRTRMTSGASGTAWPVEALAGAVAGALAAAGAVA
jgi:hypothetical protein